MSKLLLTAAVFIQFAVLSGCTTCASPAPDTQAQKCQVIAHRGSSGAAPENTLASAKLAWQQKADAVEIDIHLTKDNKIVVIHDGTTKRTAGVDLKVSETTADELRKLDVGSFKDSKYAGEKIPFLDQVIATVPKGKKLFVEVKCGPEILPYLEETFDKSKKRDQMVLISFNLEVLTQAKQQMPDVPAYWLRCSTYDKEKDMVLPYDPELIKTCKERNIDGLDLNFGGLTNEFISQLNENNMPLYVWTVNDMNVAKSMLDFNVTGITTNLPAELKAEYNL